MFSPDLNCLSQVSRSDRLERTFELARGWSLLSASIARFPLMYEGAGLAFGSAIPYLQKV